MKVTFYSNFLNHHQLPFCNEMYKRLGDNFKFVATESTPQERINMGYHIMENDFPFLVKTYDINGENKAMELSKKSDIVIIGSAPEKYVKRRLELNQFVFRYQERIFKKGQWRVISPRVIKNLYNSHLKYLSKNCYMLCASAYTAADFSLVGAYKNKTFKWGYFPEVREYEIKNLLLKKKNSNINILWVGRLIDWKHCDKAIEIAKRLKRDKYRFQLNIIGQGEKENYLRELVDRNMLNECVTFLGSMSPEKVRGYMEMSNIYLFTSDFNEGWGAVLNEAMNSGCAVVASHAIGSVPFLINHKVNGLIYKNDDINDLYNNVKLVIDDNQFCEKLGENAYLTLKNQWSPKIATENLITLFSAKLNNEKFNIDNGPCSKAMPIPQRKMYHNVTKSKE